MLTPLAHSLACFVLMVCNISTQSTRPTVFVVIKARQKKNNSNLAWCFYYNQKRCISSRHEPKLGWRLQITSHFSSVPRARAQAVCYPTQLLPASSSSSKLPWLKEQAMSNDFYVEFQVYYIYRHEHWAVRSKEHAPLFSKHHKKLIKDVRWCHKKKEIN